MPTKLSLLAVAVAASVLPARAANIAQFNPGSPKPAATVYLANGSANVVSFVTGTPLNPTGTNSFTVRITNSIAPTNLNGTPAWAITSGIPGIPSGTTVSQANLSPIIAGLLNTTDGLDVLAFKAGVGSLVTITLDFSNLPGGYLPAGSGIAYSDVDYLESTTLTGTAGWYNAAGVVRMDVTNGVVTGTGEDDTTVADWTGFAGSGGTVTLTGASKATDSPGVFIPLATNLTTLTIVAQNPSNTADFYQSFAVVAIPEPGALILAALAPLAMVWRQRKLP